MFFKRFRISPEVKKALPWTPYCGLRLPFIASLRYINSPKLAKGHQKEIDKPYLNNKEQNGIGYLGFEFSVDPVIH
jgi:hypothetical protein